MQVIISVVLIVWAVIVTFIIQPHIGQPVNPSYVVWLFFGLMPGSIGAGLLAASLRSSILPNAKKGG
ncbi:MAG: hypothetical protein Q7S53_03530 [bacterium]|nr:hypothetical protein [bacterium]